MCTSALLFMEDVQSQMLLSIVVNILFSTLYREGKIFRY